MAEEKKVPMKVLRSYPRAEGTFAKGQLFHATEAQAKAMEEAKPPYGERISKTEAKKLSAEPAPTPEPKK